MSTIREQVESLIIWWNTEFPLDRAYRKKYNIAFNSVEHQNTNQIDVLFEQMENNFIAELELNYNKKENDKIVSESKINEVEQNLFDKMKF